MGFSVIPTKIGGISINSALSPLAALLTPSGGVKNMMYPSDLGSNPAMGHAVVFQAYDYTTELNQQAEATVRAATAGVDATIAAGSKALESFKLGNVAGTQENSFQTLRALGGGIGNTLVEGVTGLAYLTQAPNYQRQKKRDPLTTISLFMPDSLSVSYTSSYGEVSMTQELGTLGYIGNAVSDMKHKDNWAKSITPYAVGLLSSKIGDVAGDAVGKMAAQAVGQVTNPQMQLLYKGIDLRTFQLEFILTPKTAAEAQTVKDICDSFTFYSLPGLAGAQTGNSGQFLTPPQLFSIQFKFLGQNGIVGSLSNIFSSALTNSGLGFLSSGDSKITNGSAAKVFTVGDCVLENVSVNYAPNGWATYNDGQMVQTILTLQFKETQMLTKQYFNDSKISQNYNLKENTETMRSAFNPPVDYK